MNEKVFGTKNEREVYTERTGAYGIGFTIDNKIPAVKTYHSNGEEIYLLLGGGIEENESHAECIERELLEEAGLAVKINDLICKGELYDYIENKAIYFHAVAYFYFIDIGEIVTEPTEPNHYLVWLSVGEAKEKLFLPHQIWAVEQAYKIHTS